MERLQEIMETDLNLAVSVLLLLGLAYGFGLYGALGSQEWKIDRMYRYFRNKYEEENQCSVDKLDLLKEKYPSREKKYWLNFKKNIRKLFTRKTK